MELVSSDIMALSKLVREKDDYKLPDNWYTSVEKAKHKAGKFLKKVAAVEQTSSVVVGKFSVVDIDRMFQSRFPYCKIMMDGAVRFRPDGGVQAKIGDIGMFFVSKPEVILSLDELAKRYPKVHDEVMAKLKAEQWF